MRLVLLVLVLSVVVLPGARADPGSSVAQGSYAALGDSYSSGTGTRAYLRDGTACRRSPFAYPARLARRYRLRLAFRACSGATVADVRREQVAALSSATRYVTVSAGGNDVGFARVLRTCARPWWLADCGRAVSGGLRVVNEVLPGRLDALDDVIRARAPAARVVVVGYPRLFMGADCNAATFFSPGEEARLNATADRLNQVLAAAAHAHGFGFADPTSRFAGHAVCDDAAWINGLSDPLAESFHPNRTGQASGLTPLVEEALDITPR